MPTSNGIYSEATSENSINFFRIKENITEIFLKLKVKLQYNKIVGTQFLEQIKFLKNV